MGSLDSSSDDVLSAGDFFAVGFEAIAADSFIVYFERIRDELREGRNLESAVEAGWKRAIRTILISDAVSFTAAVVLYLLTSSSVRGFAFTLGLTTLIDLLVVTMFTVSLDSTFLPERFLIRDAASSRCPSH